MQFEDRARPFRGLFQASHLLAVSTAISRQLNFPAASQPQKGNFLRIYGNGMASFPRTEQERC
jgi:hypothetical protein